MRRIIAIGGGEIDKFETLEIDKEIIRLSEIKNPKILFIPTASNEAKGYIDSFNNLFGNELGCETDVLLLLNSNIEPEKIRDKILNADIIYVGGGNTEFMIQVWKENDVDVFLKEAYEKGIILSGLSAGAICWFETGINLVDGLLGPHYQQKNMKEQFDQWVSSVASKGIALEDGCAIELTDDSYRIIKSDKSASAYTIWFSNGKLVKRELNNDYYLKRETLFLE